MALETLMGITEINGEKLADGAKLIKEIDAHIEVDHNRNRVTFCIQNGPIKEVGKNGCQVEDIIATAKVIIEGLNTKFPCRENSMVITKLDEAIMWSKKRTSDRQSRNVEGLSKA